MAALPQPPAVPCQDALRAGWRAAGRLLLSLLPAGAAWAEPDRTPPPKDPAASGWVFEFLPKAFQRNPRLDLTVITEVTPEGKKLPEVTVEHPAYYLAQSGGYHQTVDAPAGNKTLPPDTMDAFVRRSLATRGYYPASTEKPPSLVLFYNWGLHSRLEQDDSVSSELIARNLLERAALVGGEKFRTELTALMEEATIQADAVASASMRNMTVGGEAVAPVLGPEQLEFINPINRFRNRSAKNEFLLEQVSGGVYYVIVSAYAHEALLKNQRVLLWRTRMTVSADGVSQTDSLPTLINSAAPYFGREMSEPATLTPRTFPEGRVKLGPTVFPDFDPVSPPPAETGPRK